MGNCLAGESCIFSHDPALLLNRLKLDEDSAITTPALSQLHPSFQVQDYDAFPVLQSGARNQWAKSSSSPNQAGLFSDSHSQCSNGYTTTPRRPFQPKTASMNGLPSSPKSTSSRPNSRHQSRAPTPSIPLSMTTRLFNFKLGR